MMGVVNSMGLDLINSVAKGMQQRYHKVLYSDRDNAEYYHIYSNY